MLFYTQLQQMDGKWNDKWVIMGRKWMKYMSISDGKMDNSMAQQQLVVTFEHGTCLHFIQSIGYSACFQVDPLS